MSPSALAKPIARVLLGSVLLTTMYGAGVATGVFVIAENHPHEDHDDHHDEGLIEDHDETEQDHEEEEDHVALTEQAFHNLQLTLGHISQGDYWKSALVPGRVVEIPGRSDLSVSAPVAGIVDHVYVLPGQSLLPDQTLFDIRLTDQALTDAQSKLLATLTKKEVAQSEITRLKPLQRTGAITGARIREMEYELKRLEAEQATIVQELRGRGLPDLLIDTILKEKRLATSLRVPAPDFVQASSDSSVTGYSVEYLKVHPGKSIDRGEDLCSVAYHSDLYIEGSAFDEDFETLNQIVKNGWEISVETGIASNGGLEQGSAETVRIQRVDNHVDETTQTIRFYTRLRNSVVRTHQEDEGSFDQWRFRPGQRLHLRLPIQQWKNQIMVPADAIAIDGPNVMVFKTHELDPPEEGVFIEFHPVPVRLLHKDDQTAVIANDGQLNPEMEIALNHGNKLYLAMKMHAAGGAGHHHHDH